MRRLALVALGLSACGVEGLSRDVYLHQVAAAEAEAAGDPDRAAAHREKIERDQAKLQRREYNVPPTPYW
jgi:hypothetical protein